MHCSLLTNAQNSNPCQVRTLTLVTDVKEKQRHVDERAGRLGRRQCPFSKVR